METDYLFWTVKKSPLPEPLLTIASLSDPLPGALGQPGTKRLLGNRKIDMGWQNGFLIGLGAWIEKGRWMGFESNFFLLPRKSQKQSVHTSGEPGSLNIAVPIFDVTGLWGLNGVPGEAIFILPGPLFGPGFEGRFSLKISSRLQGVELNAIINFANLSTISFDFLGGFRWLQLRESLSFAGQTAALPNSSIAEGFYNFRDGLLTNNNFFGAQIGLKACYSREKFGLMSFAKVAAGPMNQNIRIRGTSRTSDGNLFYSTKNTANRFLSGGIFAQPTNHGLQRQSCFAAAFEAGTKLFFRLTESFEIGLGYNFLGVTSIARPGDQIDRKINPTRTALAEASRESVGIGPTVPVLFGSSAAAPLPFGSKRPKVKRCLSNFWVQGLTISLDLKF